MLAHLRNSNLLNLFWGFMAVFMLNISVDTRDPNPEHIAEDLSINDQESIVELVVEQMLGYEDAIAEYDDNDSEGRHKKPSVSVHLFPGGIAEPDLNELGTDSKTTLFARYSEPLSPGYPSLISPPPRG